MPSLRKTLVQLLTEIQHSGMSRNKEQSARMLSHLIISTPRLISAYMKPILTKLVPKLREPESNPGVILNVLRAIGDLAEVNGGSNEMERWADELLAILLEILDAGSPEKRSVTLWYVQCTLNFFIHLPTYYFLGFWAIFEVLLKISGHWGS